MKFQPLIGLLCVCLLGIAMFGQAEQKPSGYPHLKAEALSIVNCKGESVITLTGTEKGPGIWLKRPNGDQIAITAMSDHNFAVMILPKDSNGAAIAISQDRDGSGMLQFRDAKGEIHFLPLEKLATVFGK